MPEVQTQATSTRTHYTHSDCSPWTPMSASRGGDARLGLAALATLTAAVSENGWRSAPVRVSPSPPFRHQASPHRLLLLGRPCRYARDGKVRRKAEESHHRRLGASPTPAPVAWLHNPPNSGRILQKPVKVSLSYLTRQMRVHHRLTCRIASLCISPEQAGIMLFRRANSSFILDLRRRSIRLCAVFLAIFLPATLVLDGCFLLLPVEVAGAPSVAAPAVLAVGAFVIEALPTALAEPVSSWGRGFICMILRERVGGGGRANWSLGGCAADDRRRDFTVSLG